ncbi:GDSL-type esterase/lipase family protein [Nesterenkonia ebinurensis]|uniref:GDSL-type esterase/lipase family protein n=1 Tax=Nesterenkonia ebinurensis TaxID=2608252 RepID=UPI001CC4366E|nr:GDSL-type esterase/lipase family protein [Nesterenkonia ebinurensis]
MTSDPTITTPVSGEFIHGAVELERTARGLLPHRLNSAARAQLGGPVDPSVFSQPSGVRVRLHSEAVRLELVTWPQKHQVLGAPVTVPPVYDIWCGGQLLTQLESHGGTLTTEDPATGQVSRQETGPGIVVLPELPAGSKTVEIWLPLQEPTELIELRSDVAVVPASVPEDALRWVHHGSSISHGYDAVGASHAWPAVAARTASVQGRSVELTNLGFAGNAMLDPFAARTIRDLEADLISLKLGINVVNGDSHTLRTFAPAVHGFLDTIREGRHSQTPILVISPIWCGIHEQTPGPVEAYDQPVGDWLRTGIRPAARTSAGGTLRRFYRAIGKPEDTAKGRLTLEFLRAELARVIAQRTAVDPNLHYLDGLGLYGAGEAAIHPLPDDLHPGPEAHELIGRRFASQLLHFS